MKRIFSVLLICLLVAAFADARTTQGSGLRVTGSVTNGYIMKFTGPRTASITGITEAMISPNLTITNLASEISARVAADTALSNNVNEVNAVGYIFDGSKREVYTDIDALFSALGNNMSAYINAGNYTVSSSQKNFSSLTNLSIVCHNGIATFTGKLPGGADIELWKFLDIENLVLRNLVFILDLDSGEYTSGHAYNVACNAQSGVIDNCGFLLDSSLSDSVMVSPNHCIAFVMLAGSVATPRKIVIRDSWFASFNSDASPCITQVVAVHANGGSTDASEKTVFDNCRFIVNRSLPVDHNNLSNGVAKYNNCFTTELTPYMPNVGLMNWGDAVRYLPLDYRSYLDQSDTYAYCRSNDDGRIGFYSESWNYTNGWFTVLKVVSDDTRGASENYRLQIDAVVSGNNINGSRVAFDGVTRDGVNLALTHVDYHSFSSVSRVVSTNGNFELQVKGDASSPVVTAEGSVKLHPSARYINGLSVADNVTLEFFESE